MILAIDPGKDKCGLAVLDSAAQVLERKVVQRHELSNEVTRWIAKYRVPTVIIGSGTFSKAVQKELTRLDLNTNIVFVPEKNTTLLARVRYFKENPPRGLLRFIPKGLLSPPGPVDDYAAVILGERYLKG